MRIIAIAFLISGCAFPRPGTVAEKYCTAVFQTARNSVTESGFLVIDLNDVKSLICSDVWVQPEGTIGE